MTATAKPNVSIERMKKPTGFFAGARIANITATITAMKYSGCVSQDGVKPKNRFRKVPPEIEATSAISTIPP